jgi:uncharacterized membrane protein YcaP (DUF421 family)
MKQLFFESGESLLRTFLITIMAYVLLIVMLRASGKRTLSKMNAFDFIVTIALGSTLATVSLNKSVPLADGLLSFFLLIFLQYGLTWLASRSQKVGNLVRSTPSLLVYRGELLRRSMRKERIAEDEIAAVVRQHGLGSLEEVDAIVLETDGSMSLIRKLGEEKEAVMQKVKIPGGEKTKKQDHDKTETNE